MSSHHFVKEGQEPALIILEPIRYPISDLLEWAPAVIISSTVIDLALLWGIKIDVVIADANAEHSIQEKLSHQYPLEIISKHEHESELSAVARYLKEHQIVAVNICMNEPPENFEVFEALTNQVDLSVFDHTTKWSMIPAGDFQKWMKKDSVLSFRSTGRITVSGNARETGGNRLTVLNDGLIRIKSDGLIWIGQSHV